MSLMTLLTIPVCPLSFPAVITTLSPRNILYFPLGNMALIAFLFTPILKTCFQTKPFRLYVYKVPSIVIRTVQDSHRQVDSNTDSESDEQDPHKLYGLQKLASGCEVFLQAGCDNAKVIVQQI